MNAQGTEHEIAIRGGLIIDGTGRPSRIADLGLSNGYIAEIGGHVRGRREIDARGAVVTPGFIDMHTHYDAQVFWDPALTPSSLQGVTSVVGGNCGFSLAPCRASSRESMLRALEFVEDMDPDTLREGIDWSWETFPEYLRLIEQRGTGINFGSFVGHTAVRLFVMGPDAYDREATPEEIDAMTEVVTQALAAGALGFSTDRSNFHRADGGRPVPSVMGSDAELRALLGAVSASGRGICQIIASPEDYEWVFDLQPQIGRPFTWCQIITWPEGSPRAHLTDEQLARQAAASAAGLAVYAQATCRPITFQVTFANPMPLYPAPSFGEIAGADARGRRRLYRDEQWRSRARADLASKKYVDPAWDKFVLEETTAHQSDIGRSVADLAAAAGRDPLDVVLDLVLDDDLSTRFRVTFANDNEEQLARILSTDGCVIGLSDAGAHVDQMCDANMPTEFLATWVRDRELMSLEKGVHKITGELAGLLGLTDRGELSVGKAADIVVMDLEALDPGPLRRVTDFPAGRERLVADQPQGLQHILVNGQAIRTDGVGVDSDVKAGRMLSPGR
jgi:N-acyl-D-amino-acid deacylase